jgi:hypothetical protein
VPEIRSDPEYDEPVNLDMEPEAAFEVLLGVEPDDENSEETT